MPLREQLCVLTGGHKMIKNEEAIKQDAEWSTPGWCKDNFYCVKCKRIFDLTPAHESGGMIRFTSCPESGTTRAGYTPEYFHKS